MRYIKNDAYVLRKIDTTYILVPFKRTKNNLKLFNFNEIGGDIIENCNNFKSIEDMKKTILQKYELSGLTDEIYDNFIKQLLEYELLLEVE